MGNQQIIKEIYNQWKRLDFKKEPWTLSGFWEELEEPIEETERLKFLGFERERQAKPERFGLEKELSLVLAETKLDCIVKLLEEAITQSHLIMVFRRNLFNKQCWRSLSFFCEWTRTRGRLRMRDEIWNSSCHVDALVTVIGLLAWMW